MTSINKIKTVVLSVEGMTCNHCVMRVTNALKGVKGVRIAKVDLQGKTAEVTFDPDETNEKKMIAAVEEAGYQAKVKA